MATRGEIVVTTEYAVGEDSEATAEFGLFMPVPPRIGELMLFERVDASGDVSPLNLELCVVRVGHVFGFGDTPVTCERRTEVFTKPATWMPGEELAALLLRHSAVLWVNLNDGKGERRPDRPGW